MEFIKRIQSKSVKVAVIGLGYVGLPMAVTVAKKGFHVLGIDVSDYCVQNVNAGKNYIGDVEDADLENVVSAGLLTASKEFSGLRECDVILIAVPTPLDKYQQPDTSYIRSATDSIAEYISKDTLVVLESTTYPGTTVEIIVPPLTKKGFFVGKDVYVAFSPERVDPGNESYKTHNTPKVVGGITENCNKVSKAFYEAVLDAPVHTVSSPAAAEMEKIYENTFRNINIALANEMTILCERMGISVWEVIDAAKTKPYGFMAFYPGPGVGGHCIPIDPFYLTWKAREYNYHTRLIELAGEINNSMPEFVLTKSMKLLNKRGIAISKAKIMLLGAAYKRDIRDMRESPVHPLIVLLEEHGVSFDVNDPYVPKFHNELNDKHYTTVELENLDKYDLVIIITDHSCYDYKMIVKESKLVLDTRNACKGINSDNLILL